jgi:putative NIF3 family GTP cyclohydrolase 1 type 2
MPACAEIIGYLDALLDPDSYDDYGPNGLQVPARDEIQTVIAGVEQMRLLVVHARA